MKQPKVGSIVEVIFDDHSEGMNVQRFRVYGLLTKITCAQYTVAAWVYDSDPLLYDNNVEGWSIVRKAVVSCREV